MASIKVPIVLICALMATLVAMPHIACAQNSPKDFVDAHNPARAEVGVPPLTWDKKLEAYAQKYANERSKDCDMVHSHGPYGESLAAGSWDLSAKEAVDMWTGEKKFYDVGKNTCIGDECLHYTQVVWRGTAHVGCARAKCTNGWTFVTCNYDPPGNVIGRRPY